ncbi:MAG: DUF4124 domain-containing protein, partial [Gammaproteobacteria bacterium]|nr:DUF4124 domain-containing protein [Gammaproteobacteria bacterium]
MIAALILAVLLPFTILKGRDGKAMMSFTDFSLPDFSLPKLPKLPNIDMLGASDENLEGKDIFYKWFDAKGNVQFTTEPPADGIEYTVRGFDPNTNVIQAVDVPAKETTADKAAPSTANPEDIGSPYSQESIKKLFEDAKNIEKLLKQRAKDQESAL